MTELEFFLCKLTMCANEIDRLNNIKQTYGATEFIYSELDFEYANHKRLYLIIKDLLEEANG